MEKKDKKKTLTISSNLKKKIDTSSISSDGKKSYSVEKKKPFKGNKNINRINQSFGQINNPEIKKLLKREKLASLGEATIYEKCLVYETDLIKGMEHEFERYRKEATVAIVKQEASNVNTDL